MKEWTFADNGKPSVPCTAEELREMLTSGTIQPSTLVWKQGMPQWVAAGACPELVPPGTVLPPPLPVAQAYMPPPNPIANDAAMRMLIPVGRSGWAIAAGYCGLFALIPILAPIAIIVSIVALRDLKKHPESHGKGRAIFGLVMGCLFTIGPLIIIAIAASSH